MVKNRRSFRDRPIEKHVSRSRALSSHGIIWERDITDENVTALHACRKSGERETLIPPAMFPRILYRRFLKQDRTVIVETYDRQFEELEATLIRR